MVQFEQRNMIMASLAKGFLFIVLAIPAAIWAISSPFIGGLAVLACLFTAGQALGRSS
jgi:hypothetical protein